MNIKCLVKLLGIITTINLIPEFQKKMKYQHTPHPNFSGIENTQNELRSFVVFDVSRTFKGDFDEFQSNYNITVSNGNNTIGSLYVVHLWKQLEKNEEVKPFKKIWLELFHVKEFFPN